MRAVLAGVRVQLALVALTPMVFLEVLLQPLAYGTIVASQLAEVSAALVLGIALFGMWGAILGHAAIGVVAEKQWRTLEFGVIAPTPIGLPLMGKVIAAALNGLVGVPVVWLFVGVVWGMPSDLPWLAFGCALVVGTIGVVGIGLLLVGFLARYRFFGGMLNGLYDVVAVLACLFVPALLLPAVLDVVSRAIGARWAMEAVRAAERGAEPWPDLAVGLGVSLATVALGGLYLLRFERGLRRRPEAFAL